jgi:hypothetical protein
MPQRRCLRSERKTINASFSNSLAVFEPVKQPSIKIKTTPSRKAAWVKVASVNGKTLTKWIEETCDQAAVNSNVPIHRQIQADIQQRTISDPINPKHI